MVGVSQGEPVSNDLITCKESRTDGQCRIKTWSTRQIRRCSEVDQNHHSLKVCPASDVRPCSMSRVALAGREASAPGTFGHGATMVERD